MNSLTKSGLMVIALAVASTVSSGVALAEETENVEKPKGIFERFKDSFSGKKDEVKENGKERKENRKENAGDRCEKLEEAINNRITKFDENKDKHLNHYRALKDRLQKFVDGLKEKGVDTGNLEEDLKTLDEKIKTAASSYDAFINELRESQDHTCGNSEGEFKSRMEEAREARKKFHEDLVAVRKFISEDLKSSIQEIKEQRKNTETSDQ